MAKLKIKVIFMKERVREMSIRKEQLITINRYKQRKLKHLPDSKCFFLFMEGK
jgi:hypothetical protein